MLSIISIMEDDFSGVKDPLGHLTGIIVLTLTGRGWEYSGSELLDNGRMTVFYDQKREIRLVTIHTDDREPTMDIGSGPILLESPANMIQRLEALAST